MSLKYILYSNNNNTKWVIQYLNKEKYSLIL